MEVGRMIKFIKNSMIVRILLGLIFIYLAFITFADPPGYCATQQRYISDAEFIEIAIRQEKTSMNIDGSEESIRTFHAINPDCCRVDRKHTQYLSRLLLTSVNGVEVNLQFERNEKNIKNHGGGKYHESIVITDECGKELDTYGIDNDQYYHYPENKKEQS